MPEAHPPRAAHTLASSAPWLLAIGGLGLALTFARMDSQDRVAAPVQPAVVQLAVDGEGLAVRGPHVSVDGIASIDVVPDVADVTIQVAIERPSPSEAVAVMREREAELVAALAEAGVTGSELRTSHTTVSPLYSDYPHSNRIRAYEASITVVASVCEFERIGDVLEQASRHDVRRMSTQFRSTQITAKKIQLRDMALAAAQAKAEQSVHALDATLGPVLSIQEGGQTGFGGWGALDNFVANDYASPEAPDEPLVPGAIKLRLTVHVEYGLAHAAS